MSLGTEDNTRRTIDKVNTRIENLMKNCPEIERDRLACALVIELSYNRGAVSPLLLPIIDRVTGWGSIEDEPKNDQKPREISIWI